MNPHGPLVKEWLNALHRKLDTNLSLTYRPYPIHGEAQSLEAGKVYEL